MTDPRAENARGFTESGGKVTGVELTYVSQPDSKYELIAASLIDEVSAQGTTIARVIVRNKDGIDAQVQCWLAWPWTGNLTGSWDGKGLPGSANYPYQHIITNKYNPSNQSGPLAIFIGDAQGNIDSDVIAGLGLPGGHHVGYHLVFRERGSAPPPPPPPNEDDGTASGTSGDVLERLERIEQKLDSLSAHLGVH